jgi:hypothetical protein
MINDAWDNEYVTEHVGLWVNALLAKGLDANAVRDEIDKWTMDGVTQICVGGYARTMAADVVRAIVEQALCRERPLWPDPFTARE